MVRALALSWLLLTASQSAQGSCEGGSCQEVGKESSVLMQRKNRRGSQLPLRQAAQATVEKSSSMDLFQATAQLLRLGANPNVIQFTNDTLESLQDEIIPALLHGYDEDTALLNESFARVKLALENFEHHKGKLQPFREEEAAAIKEHQSCRQTEQLSCEQQETCLESCHTLNTTYVSTETEYVAISETIEHHWCEMAGNKSAPTWRTAMTERFKHYLILGKKRIEEWQALESCVTHCETKSWSNPANDLLQVYAKKATAVDASGESVTAMPLENPCDSKMRAMEDASCSAEGQRTTVNSNFDSEWFITSSAFAEVVTTVKAQEGLRHRDFKALKGIKCLLKHIIDRAGKPCDEEDEPGEADTIIDDCEAYWQIDIHLLLTPWNITYPELPGRPEPVPAEPYPCTEEWATAQYGWLSGKCFSGMPACVACPEHPPMMGR